MRICALAAALILIILVLTGCGEEYRPTAQQFFRDKLNLDPLPAGLSDFHKVNRDEPPYTSGEGYFTYRATPSFIAALLKHDKFFNDFKKDPSNQQVRQFPCDQINYFSSAIWMDELGRISMANKVCYEGIFLPYAHILIYDPKTEMVDHFFYAVGA